MNLEAIHKKNVKWLAARGFKAAKGLPFKRGLARRLRPADEIALRAMAIEIVFTWVSASESVAPTKKVKAYAKRNGLARWMTSKEKKIFATRRKTARSEYVDTIGWKLENLWALAWVLGFEAEPPLDGKMIETEVSRAIVNEFLPKLDQTTQTLLERVKRRRAEDVVALENRFYCCHNAVRNAQLGWDTVPKRFHPIINGGVIHERRHALTWCLSPRVKWDDTDLST